MKKKKTVDQIRSRRKFLQGGLALGAMTPLVLANQAHAHGSRLKDNKDQEFIIVSIVATHPFWNDLKNGAQDAADDLGVKFSYVGPAGFDVEGQVQAMEQILIKKPAGIGQVHSTDAAYPSIQKALDSGKKTLSHSAGNFYINDKPTGAVVGQQPFGGSRASGTNDKAGSTLNLYRWISLRTIKENFNPPTDYRYPFMGVW